MPGPESEHMRTAKTEHVFFSSKTQAFECDHCGGTYVPALPMPITQFVSTGQGFAMMHRHCVKPEPPSKQLLLPHTIDVPVICQRCGGGVRNGEAEAHLASCLGRDH